MLDRYQQAAVDCTDRFIYLQAGPGSGKTRTLVARIARLLREGVSGHNILAVTFTNRAAAELRERVARDFAGDADPRSREYVEALAYLQGLEPCTMHALALRLLRMEYPKARAMPQDEADAILVEAAVHVGVRCPPSAAHMTHRTRRRLLRDAQVVERFLRLQHSLEAYSYETLESELLRMVRNSDAGSAPFFCWDEILVDEAQDLSPAQQEIVRALAHGSRLQGRRAGVFVVGDDTQSIFGWREADPERLRHVFDWTEGALPVNYRSGYEIVRACMDAAQGQPRLLSLQAARSDAGEVVRLSDPEALVLDIRDSLVPVDGEAARCAVIGRRWADLEELQTRLEDEQIHCALARPDASAWNTPGMLLLLAVLREGLYGAISDLHRVAVTRMAPALDAILLPNSGDLDWSWVSPALRVLREHDPELADSLAEAVPRAQKTGATTAADLLALALDEDPDQDADVLLITAHAAKGLEFDRVWWLDYSEHITGENQRVQFVAMSRARNRLALFNEPDSPF